MKLLLVLIAPVYTVSGEDTVGGLLGAKFEIMTPVIVCIFSGLALVMENTIVHTAQARDTIPIASEVGLRKYELGRLKGWHTEERDAMV